MGHASFFFLDLLLDWTRWTTRLLGLLEDYGALLEVKLDFCCYLAAWERMVRLYARECSSVRLASGWLMRQDRQGGQRVWSEAERARKGGGLSWLLEIWRCADAKYGGGLQRCGRSAEAEGKTGRATVAFITPRQKGKIVTRQVGRGRRAMSNASRRPGSWLPSASQPPQRESVTSVRDTAETAYATLWVRPQSHI